MSLLVLSHPDESLGRIEAEGGLDGAGRHRREAMMRGWLGGWVRCDGGWRGFEAGLQCCEAPPRHLRVLDQLLQTCRPAPPSNPLPVN